MKQITTHSFPNLPTIPQNKRWLKKMINNRATMEQVVSTKLFENKTISTEEEIVIIECIQFYKQLHQSLITFDYNTLYDQDKINYFEDYLNYAFSSNVLNGGYMEVSETFRLVSNKGGRSKTNSEQLSYPPIEVLQESNLYNRANTSSHSVFYSSESIDAVFRENKPKEKDVVTLGIWKPKRNTLINYCSIESNDKAKSVNEFARDAYSRVDKSNFPLIEYLDSFLLILNHEYSKVVNSNLEYLVSAILSEKLLNLNMKKDREVLEPHNYDAILYPSLGNEFNYSNFAIRPESVDKKLELVEVYEWKILSTNYENRIYNANPRQLTVANVKCQNFSNKIEEDGTIVWS